jgi:hypothetical protein
MSAFASLLFPRLKSFPPEEQVAALRAARETPFDVVELIGIAIGLVLVTFLTRYSVGELGVTRRVLAILLNFLFAIPLLALFVGPFWVRRVRRGLDKRLAQHSSS